LVSSILIKRIEFDFRVERRTSALAKGSNSASTGDDGTGKSSSKNTTNSTSGKSAKSRNGRSTNSSRFNVTSKIIGNVTSGKSTIVARWALDLSSNASFGWLANGIVTNIRVVAGNVGMNAWILEIERRRVANIFGTQVTIVTE